ncbi:MAG: isocitrate lyase/phosphoenolpyruvate mutase family protein, partial [Phycisphaerales bacterium]|nr:isocitrate lyase/phosphoenolpyruvate mutase family protein [Phycisphaerales bacterium]
YVDAGAEMLFPEGLRTEEEFATFANEAPDVYLLANMTEFGKTPLIPFERFDEMGYHVVIYPVTMTRVAMGAVTRALATLREEGTVESFLDDMQDREGLYRTVGYTPGTPWSFPTGRPS